MTAVIVALSARAREPKVYDTPATVVPLPKLKHFAVLCHVRYEDHVETRIVSALTAKDAAKKVAAELGEDFRPYSVFQSDTPITEEEVE